MFYTRFFVVVFLICLSAKVFSQSNKTGTWGLATLILPGSTDHRWGGYAELQGRTDETLFRKFFYYEVKGGVSYNFDNNAYALIGTGRYTTYDYQDLGKGPITGETRLWEQFTSVQFVSRVKLEHRYRAEQRWLSGVYRNRFRYRINALLPINHPKFDPNTVFLSVFDEVFFNNKAPNFERNRVCALLGYQFTKALNVQAGWINQFNNGTTISNDKNNMMLMVMYSIQRKKPGAQLPTIKD
ncbi:DUF2490 domain-containing protein [Mucilaginibacter sp. KACC 22063]|uniref:DUF2490 domain-containing protein n=1 Tax=Mucilaginibacter sp. KACC 22063 TaxID=3025666 RepID=UPI00236638EB|nr:DUF2490 domain-containing protein [Mucilaginibacter sp. KACC 22063]WDF54755.1 DUF2490 domain-containing protein [Mucilaginibacter sp. KACC 22063]